MNAQLLFFAGGILLCVLALVLAWRRRLFAARAERTAGTVLRLQEIPPSRVGRSSTYAPVVRFTAADGRTVEFTDSVSSAGGGYPAGQAVEVLYDPEDPSQASIASAFRLYFAPGVLMAIGLGWAALGGAGLNLGQTFSGALARADQFAGDWVNEDPATQGIVRVEIRSGWKGTDVRMWGRCSPQDCDWGNPESIDHTRGIQGILSMKWRSRFAVRDQAARLLPDGRLEVVTHTRFTDRSNRRDRSDTAYFRRM